MKILGKAGEFWQKLGRFIKKASSPINHAPKIYGNSEKPKRSHPAKI